MVEPGLAPTDHAGFDSESQKRKQNHPELSTVYQGRLLNLLMVFVQLSITFHSDLSRTS